MGLFWLKLCSIGSRYQTSACRAKLALLGLKQISFISFQCRMKKMERPSNLSIYLEKCSPQHPPSPPPPLSATCVNLAASFLCDDCKSGYTGNNCETGKNFAQVFRKVIASKENFYAFSSLFSSHSVRVVMDLTWRRSLGSRRCSDPPFPFLTFDYTDSFSVPLSFLGQNLYLLLLYFKTGQPTTVFSLKHFSGYQE